MREINIGEKIIKVRATPLTLLFYKQEFKSDMIGDIMKLQVVKNSPEQLDSLLFLQIIWAMEKTANFGNDFPSFTKWLETLDSFDISDADMLKVVFEEATDGFFRRGKQRRQKQQK